MNCRQSLKAFLFYAVLALTTASCIVVSTGGGNSSAPAMAFQSIPQGAQVYTDEGTCVTPCRMNLQSDRAHSVTISAPGYTPFHVDLHPQKVNMGVPSWMTLGGGMSVLQPNPVMAILDCADQRVCGSRAFIQKYGGTPQSPPP